MLDAPEITRALVFTRTKHGANRVVEYLTKTRPPVHAEAIHGNKSQGARERALANFKRGETRVLVATDIAARGIDVEAISHVINLDLPDVAETYVHRIGRTARAGAEGVSLSFCETDDRDSLAAIERLIQQHVPLVDDHPFCSSNPPPPLTDLTRSTRRQGPARSVAGRAVPDHRPAQQGTASSGQRHRRQRSR